MSGALAGKALVPAVTVEQFAWTDSELRSGGELVAKLVEDAGGKALGWFCFRPQRGATARVLAVHAVTQALAPVLDCLAVEALACGAYALQGRVENWLLPDLGARGCEFNRQAPWFLVHSKDPQVLHMLHAGEARLTQLDGERCLRF